MTGRDGAIDDSQNGVLPAALLDELVAAAAAHATTRGRDRVRCKSKSACTCLNEPIQAQHAHAEFFGNL